MDDKYERNKKNTFDEWTPIDGCRQQFFCEGIHDDYNGLQIILKGTNNSSPMLKITFDAPLAYQNTDEGNRLRTLNQHHFSSTPFYIVKNSSWCEWFVEESCRIYDPNEIVHYAVYSLNDCIDILSKFKPTAEWLYSPSQP